jgi:hypothetical protein
MVERLCSQSTHFWNDLRFDDEPMIKIIFFFLLLLLLLLLAFPRPTQ